MLDIVFEDKNIIVCRKPSGLAVQTARIGQVDMVDQVRKHLTKTVGQNSIPYVGIIHRLDQPVAGIVAFALNERTAASASKEIEQTAHKEYIAVVEKGINALSSSRLEDYLVKIPRENVSRVVDKGVKGAKRAALKYEAVDINDISSKIIPEEIRLLIENSEETLGVLRISLETGRFHQIRAQLSHAGMPIIGDSKYGGRSDADINSVNWHGARLGKGAIALCATSLHILGKDFDF